MEWSGKILLIGFTSLVVCGNPSYSANGLGFGQSLRALHDAGMEGSGGLGLESVFEKRTFIT